MNTITHVHAMVVCLLSIMLTIFVLFAAVIHWGIPKKSMLKTFVSFFVPFKMTYHFFFFNENSRTAIETMKMFPTKRNENSKSIVITRGHNLFFFKRANKQTNRQTCNLNLCNMCSRIQKNLKIF